MAITREVLAAATIACEGRVWDHNVEVARPYRGTRAAAPTTHEQRIMVGAAEGGPDHDQHPATRAVHEALARTSPSTRPGREESGMIRGHGHGSRFVHRLIPGYLSPLTYPQVSSEDPDWEELG